jgi:membrane carboxypeptidase/penicillin-binding protein PbpC
MEVTGNVDQENRNIGVNNQATGLHQQWDIIYADEWKGEPGKGELNEEFGLYVERPFYAVSEMGSHRYLDLINNRNFVLKTSNGRNTQVWYFHQQTLTIRSKYNNQSWDIKNSGKTNEM